MGVNVLLHLLPFSKLFQRSAKGDILYIIYRFRDFAPVNTYVRTAPLLDQSEIIPSGL